MIKFDKNLLLYKLPPVLYALAILSLSAISGPQAPDLGVAWEDKIYHFIEYLIFGILVWRAFPKLFDSPKWRLYGTLLVIFGLAYAAFDETVQYFVPSRDSSLGDWAADAGGYLLASLVMLCWKRKRRTAGDSN